MRYEGPGPVLMIMLDTSTDELVNNVTIVHCTVASTLVENANEGTSEVLII